MPTKTTIVELKARLVDAQKVRQEGRQLQQSLDFSGAAKSFAKMEYAAGQTFRQLKGMSGVLRDLNQSLRARDGLQGLSAMRQEVEALVASLRAANEQMRGLGGGTGGPAPAGQPGPAGGGGAPPPEPRRLTFTRGVLQGAGVGEYFPEKDVRGLWWNALGRKAGQVGAGALSSPFTGAQGFSQMLGGLPVMGGFAQGMMGMGMGRAQEALGFREAAQRDLTSLMGRDAWAPPGENEQEVNAAIRRRMGIGFAREGARFGLSAEDSVARAAQTVRAAGGSMAQLDSDRFRTLQGMQMRWGFGEETSGAFLRAGRTGGLRQGEDAMDALQDAVKAGTALGLEGSDLTRYVEGTARSLASVVETGIPLDRDSLDHLSAVLAAKGGVSPERAQMLGQAFRQYSQQVAQTGPQTVLDFAALQGIGGFRGGGLTDYVQSLERMESGEGLTEGLEQMVADVGREDLPDEGKRLLLSRRLRRMGMNVGIREAGDLMRGKTIEGMPGTGKDAEGRPMVTTKDVVADFMRRKEAQGYVGAEGEMVADPALTERKRRELQGLAAGEKLLPTFERFERVSADMLTNFTKFSQEIDVVSKAMATASEKLGSLFDGARSLLDWAYVKFGHGAPDPRHVTGRP